MNQAISLSELNGLIKLALRECFPDRYWVRAELSEVRVAGAGHCYVEFLEKESRTGNTIAKMRGNIWANTFRMLKSYFEEETGQSFASGIKVLVQVTIDFHEVYGASLNVVDIDPNFTLGDMLRRRLEIIKQLQTEKLFDQNRSLSFPILPRRLAIISSATAAGYDDFLDQLKNNGRYRFSTTLFPSMMQGDQVENSMLKAFTAVERKSEYFDAVVIIRGGGAVSDLNCFDSYLLAKRCATFPLPIITGIGHERDESILDMVAHTRTKTPTAAAEFLIGCFAEQENRLANYEGALVELMRRRLNSEKSKLQNFSTLITHATRSRISQEQLLLQRNFHLLNATVTARMVKESGAVKDLNGNIQNLVRSMLEKQHSNLKLYEQVIRFSSPETLLKKGYTLTLKEGRIVKSVEELMQGDKISSMFVDGVVESTVDGTTHQLNQK